ncbi:MAG TPA: CPBP family intramembrane glutamic endopeptidase [Terriglobia bacterium]|nr:CPBP family intramembrane glutamic endopeptidase [Terriglobia bacterium]
MPIRLNRSDLRTIVLVVLVAAASLIVAVKYFSRAFPEASINFRVNRSESLPIAQTFLKAQGLSPGGYDHAAIFGYNDETKLYLERTQGLAVMNRLTSGPIHLWRWQHRWFKPEQKEELRADVTPMGEVVGFDHELPETAPGANLEQGQARKIAEDYLRRVMKRDLGDLEFVEAVTNKRPARADHTFSWKQKSVNLGDGSLRLNVEISGDQVAGYGEYVKIPDQWSRDYERLRSRNDAAQTVDQVFWFLLSIAMLAVLILRLRDRDVPLKLALVAGGVASVLFLLEQLNEFSLAKFEYPTTDPYSSFLAIYVSRNAFLAIAVGVGIFLLVAAAEPAYREGLPGQLSLRRAFTWQGLRTRSFFIANVVGLGLTFFFFAYQAIFYLTANRLGAWAPSDIPFTNDLNTSIPWAAVLFGGFLPAVLEEMQFRAFAIPFLKKYLRNWPLAIVLAAFNWSFLHSAYPNQPFFIRGLEVGLGGIIIGFVMLRFGVVATLIWHYSVDALYTAFLLLRSPNHYLMASGALTAGIMLVPLLVALLAYWRTGTFADDFALTNASQGIERASGEEAPVTAKAAISYRPLTRRRLLVAGALIILGVAAAALPTHKFGEGVKVLVTRNDAIREATLYLNAHGVALSGYQNVAWLEDNVSDLAEKYLLQFRGVQSADRLYRQATRLALWRVRYFRPLQKEEYSVMLDVESGKVFDVTHELDENAAGASLTPDQALDLGRQFVANQGFNLADYDLQDSHQEKRKAREDYTLTWQAKAGNPLNVGDARYRLELSIAGDQPVGFSHYFKLPEAWERQQSQRTLANDLFLMIKLLVGGGLFGGALWLFVHQVRQNQVRWRRTLLLSAVTGVIFLVSEINALDLVRRNYPTSLPLSTFNLFIVVGYLIVFLGVALGAWLSTAFVAGLYPNAWGVFEARARRAWARDAAIALVLAVALSEGIGNLAAAFFDRLHAYTPVGGPFVNPALAVSFPGLDFYLGAISGAVFSVAALAVLIYLVNLGWRTRSWWLWAGVVLLLAGLGSSSAHSAGEFFTSWAVGLVQLLAGFVVVACFIRDNISAYIAVAFAMFAVPPLSTLLRDPEPFFRWNGVALAALVILSLAWLLWPRGPRVLDSAPGEIRTLSESSPSDSGPYSTTRTET